MRYVERRSVWDRERAGVFPAFVSRDEEPVYDDAVVGAGITGLTAALLLKRAGRRVAVVDAERVGAGETLRTTAHLTEVVDVRFHELVRRHGVAETKLIAAAQRSAIATMAALADSLGVAYAWSWVSGYLYAEDDEQLRELEKEIGAAVALGLHATPTTSTPLPMAVRAALRFDNQAQLDPAPYVEALAAAIAGEGSNVFERTRVVGVEEGEPCRVECERGVLRATNVLVAANVPVNNRFAIHTKLVPYRTYAIAARLREPPPRGLFWDLAQPYHYVRSAEVDGEPVLIVGGEDHKVGEDRHTEVHTGKLETYARERFGELEVTHAWSGQIIETMDGLPYIGRNTGSEHVYVATGFAGNGMTQGTLAAMTIASAITGKEDPFANLFKATRMAPARSLPQYVKENAKVAGHFVADRLRGSFAPLDTLERDEGRVVFHGGHRYAVYRDPEGRVHALSAICPHLRCTVQWNTAEKTWDCPCHGSRFTPDGRVLNGPAASALPARELPSDGEESDLLVAGEPT